MNTQIVKGLMLPSLACSRLSDSRNGKIIDKANTAEKGVQGSLSIFFHARSVLCLSPLSRSLEIQGSTLTVANVQNATDWRLFAPKLFN